MWPKLCIEVDNLHVKNLKKKKVEMGQEYVQQLI